MGELSVRDRMLAASREAKPVYEPHEVDGLGTIYVKKLNTGERDRFDTKLNDDKIGNRVAVMLNCCFDERGIRIFEPDEAEVIRALDPDVVDPIVVHAMTLNGLRENKSEALAKNSNGQGDKPSTA